MATPQGSITTVNGRRCTRTRVRTLVTTTFSTDLAQATSTQAPSQDVPAVEEDAQQVQQEQQVQQVQQPQTTQAAAPSPPPASTIEPPPPPPPTAAQEAAQEAATSPTATPSPATSPRPAPLANVAPTPPAANAPVPVAVESDPDASDTEAAAIPPVSTGRPPLSSSGLTTSLTTPPPPTQLSSTVPLPSGPAQPSIDQGSGEPEQPTETNVGPAPTSMSMPAGPDGIIGPEQDSGQGSPFSISRGIENVGGIVGGAVGAFAGVVLITVLLFLCLRKRKSRSTFGRWQQRISDEKDERPRFAAKLTASTCGWRTKAAGVFAKLGKKRPDSIQSPLNPQSVRSSISSVYATRPNRRSQSMSEPPSKFRQQLRNMGQRFGDRMPSLKRSRTLLQKRQDSLVVGAKSPFPGIVDDPVLRSGNGTANPFADPGPLEPPRSLHVLNPDPNSRETTPRLPRNLDGLQEQQRPPITPKAATLSNRGSNDPFASILDGLEDRKGNSTPEWHRYSVHKRTQSAMALRSHPPSRYSASIYTTAENPFWDPSDAQPVLQQPLPPDPPKRPMNAYTAGLPTFDATSSNASRESTGSFFFGEPGPSRPTTDLFSEVSTVSAVPRVGRQSDPFDLDRPEVLGFGRVGGRQVRASVTRSNSRTKRTSSVPNWVNVDDGPYDRASAVPGPLRNPSIKR
ncbi:uncharacterized protein EI97DRAFT_435612 [Westerdykella ornata]|uniref:Uncharacterized protein n=1 Tax=Westerdykella ornata TaxID=318751 RepID=A0A6A6JCM1_WESOR|nr:uncharacterized protein EI97DRAFT_435612 [Westerdykella ornata]KAF2273964.1 hypothetical protein EI97DRAFT_435612 [Westerdykella ornata]